jgi:hypothetical protein
MSPGQLLFSIQPSAPIVQPAHDAADLAAAIAAIYPMDTEDAILNWNRVPVRIGYRYDLSVLIDDLLPLLAAVSEQPAGEYRVEWGSDTFAARWDLGWSGDELGITSEWHSISGDYQELLNDRRTVALRRAEFLGEWCGLLAKVLSAVERSGVLLERTSQLEQLRKLVSPT